MTLPKEKENKDDRTKRELGKPKQKVKSLLSKWVIQLKKSEIVSFYNFLKIWEENLKGNKTILPEKYPQEKKEITELKETWIRKTQAET